MMAETDTVPLPHERTYRDLDAWSHAMTLAEETLRTTRPWRASDQFSIGLQLRRAAISIPSNIAEGYSRRSPAAARNHVAIALGSHGEFETQLELARRCALVDEATHLRLSTQCALVGKLLSGLYRSAVKSAEGSTRRS
ncbi:four helix bundle protein [Luteitalea sp.]|jgi:four helix bundle protein|uniref:four helix bundle protein n=1 Tax=Luteitalea sp. TaxID=2004800 RepID=UPI0037C91216